MCFHRGVEVGLVVVCLLLTEALRADADTIDVGAAYSYKTITAGVNAAGAGDTIIVHSGNYGEQVTIPSAKSGLTIQGDGTYPAVNPSMGENAGTVFKVQAANVTIQGLSLSNGNGAPTAGVDQHGVWDGAWTTGPSGLTVDDCNIHDLVFGIRSYGDNLTVTNSEFYHVVGAGVEASGPAPQGTTPLSMTVTGNWFHDGVGTSSGSAGVKVKYGRRYGEVSYNYISGVRMALAAYYGGPNPTYTGGQNLSFIHNTIDMSFAPGDGTRTTTMGLSLWGTGPNADHILVQDNIFANTPWYALYQEGAAAFTGPLVVNNNLFYNSNWYYWPDFQYANQWIGNDVRGIAGWADGDLNSILFTNNLSAPGANDPLFNYAGLAPEDYWALWWGSAAAYSASDGTNIGAWQLQPLPEPASLLALLTLGAMAFLRQRARRRVAG